MRETIRVMLVCAVALWAVGCDDDDETEEPIVGADAGGPDGSMQMDAGIDASGTVITVNMMANKFVPDMVTAKLGDTIRWVNMDIMDHTVTSGASSSAEDMPGTDFDEIVAPGGTWDYVVDEVETEPYFCRIHEAVGMTGTITVTQ